MRVKLEKYGTIQAPKSLLNIISLSFSVLSERERKNGCNGTADFYQYLSDEIYKTLNEVGYYD